MIISLDELFLGKPTMIKKKEYLSTREYVEPFLDLVSPFTNDIKIEVKTPTQVSISNKSEDTVYNRVLIQATLPKEHDYDNHQEVVGFLYGLDCAKPVVKTYRGYLNMACTNLSVFSSSWLNTQEIKPGEDINYNIKELMSLANGFKNEITALKNEFIDRDEIFRHLGKWVDYCLTSSYDNSVYSVKVPQTLPINAYKSIFLNKKSPYYVEDVEEVSLFDLHEAMTQVITDDTKEILNRFEKTLMVNQMIDLVKNPL